MTLKELANIARLLDGIDLEKCFEAGRFMYPALFEQLGEYRLKELKKGYKEKFFFFRIRRIRHFARYILDLINEYGYELSTLTNKGKPSKVKSTAYENVMGYMLSLKQLGYDPEKYCIKDASAMITAANRNALQGNIESVRSQLNPNNKNIFDLEHDMIEDNYEDEVKSMLDRYTEIIKDQK